MKTSPLLALTALLLSCNTSSITPGNTLVSSGTFYTVAHQGMGTASIYKTPSGDHILKLENFSVDNGPVLDVYLSGAVNPMDSKSVSSAAYVNVGALQKINGDQTYAIASSVNLGDYKSVVIWCTEFSVNFISAGLQ
jgi:hypothetical protein